jgi:putative DNA primase/helicase
MDFKEFALSHGLLIEYVIEGRWMRVSTIDKPKHKNGSYKFLGSIGFVQNHATMTEPATWKPGADAKPFDYDAMQRRIEAERKKTIERQQQAAKKAAWILGQCRQDLHPYLERKGFPEGLGMVWETDGSRLLVVPMRINQNLVGVQLIDRDGGKKFLSGQITTGATFQMGDGKGIIILCEGYATALSIRKAIQSLKMRATIVACFSAGNMKNIAKKYALPVIVADNDASGTGQRVAAEIGGPVFLPPDTGEDFNDFANRVGNFRACQALRPIIANLIKN